MTVPAGKQHAPAKVVLQVPKQQGRLAEQEASWPAPSWQQAPSEHLPSPPGTWSKQLLPQAPQLSGSPRVRVQVPPQQRPKEQVLLSGAGTQVLPEPQVWHSPQLPQFRVPPQPSEAVPQVCPAGHVVAGTHIVVVVVVLVEVVLVEEEVVVVVVVLVVVVVDVVGHGVVRGRHLRTNASRSLRGLVPFAAVAFAESRTRTKAGCVAFLSGSGIATKLPQAEPSSEPGTAAAGSLGLTKSFWSPVGGWQAARFGSVWLMQTATLNVQEPLPHSPSVSQGSPSVQETTLPPRTSGPGLSMPTTLNST